MGAGALGWTKHRVKYPMPTTDEIDQFLATGQKILLGRPVWRNGNRVAERRLRHAISYYSSHETPPFLEIIHTRTADLVSFTIGIFWDYCVCRVDFGVEGDNHVNPPHHQPSLSYLSAGPYHYHRWSDNRLGSGRQPKELDFARPLQQNLRSFDSVARMFLADNQIECPFPMLELEPPSWLI